MSTQQHEELNGVIADMDSYVHKAYQSAIDYYRQAGRSNNRNYKLFRFLTISLGAVVTLISSMAATSYIQNSKYLWVTGGFALATPIIAAILTVITGLSQSFQWGATWRDMSIHGQKIAAARDRFLATPQAERNHRQALEELDKLILAETESFFHRILATQMEIPEPRRDEPAQVKSAKADEPQAGAELLEPVPTPSPEPVPAA